MTPKTGAERAALTLSDKLATNAKLYAHLPPPEPSRQMARRLARKAVKRSIAAAKREIISGRRKRVANA